LIFDPVNLVLLDEFIWSSDYKYACAFKLADDSLIGSSHIILEVKRGLADLINFLEFLQDRLRLPF